MNELVIAYLFVVVAIAAAILNKWIGLVAAAVLYLGVFFYSQSSYISVRAHIDMARANGESEDFIRGVIAHSGSTRVPAQVALIHSTGLFVIVIVGAISWSKTKGERSGAG